MLFRSGEVYIASFDKILPDEAETKIASERAVPEWKLNKAYVDSLLQRIRALGDYDDNTDELDALNAELDAILEQLRRQ